MEDLKVKQLQEVLGALGAPKYGKKTDMVKRIKKVVCDEKPKSDKKEKKPSKASKPSSPAKPASPARLYLKATYKEKEAVKALGARWDPKAKVWWTDNTAENKVKFSKWM